MPFALTMPKLSPTMEEGAIVKWHKKEGDRVEAGDLLLEIATDKATVEHEALDEGWLRKILIAEGGEATVNQPIAIFTEEESESIEGFQVEEPKKEEIVEEAPQQQEEKKAAPTAALAGPSFTPAPPLEDYTFTAATPSGKASPLARKLAEEQGLDLSSLSGSGPGGRIVKEDLARAQPAGIVSFGSTAQPTLPPGTYEEEALTPMRKAVGTRLQQSKTFVPHFYVTQEIDAEAFVATREQLKSHNVKVTYNDLIIRAAALALRKHPNINTGFNTETNKIIHFKTIDISIAVSMDGGLITPILRHADYKNTGQISVEVKELIKKARARKLQPQEYTGGSFTISNLGMFGVSNFIGVINPPQSSILSISGIRDAPVIKDGHVRPGKQIAVTISCDHRVVDGADAAAFLQTLADLIENPALLLV